jgi:transposase
MADWPAEARGVVCGRQKKMQSKQHEPAKELVLDGKSIRAVAGTFDVHLATIYHVIKG